jgi:pimeloyl-ACP methyl ester carboxylesterase
LCPRADAGPDRGVVLRLLLGLVAAVALAAVTGAVYQWLEARADRERFPPPGRLVTVDDLTLHLDCRGAGQPVVVLEAGLTMGSSSWALVHNPIARHTRTCAYDRPGLDWSEPLGRPASSGEVAKRLHLLLGASDVAGPLVLVGMSAGGVFVREYQRRYPERVAGMVLVDSSHEQQGLRVPGLGSDSAADMQRALAWCARLQPLGVVRLGGLLDRLLDGYGIPAEARPLLLANANQSHSCAAMRDESRAFGREVLDPDPPAPLGDLPLVVISQGEIPKPIPALGQTEQAARAQRAAWDVLQRELAGLSTRARHLVAADSGHMIQLEQPDLVTEAVVDLVTELRAAGAGASP